MVAPALIMSNEKKNSFNLKKAAIFRAHALFFLMGFKRCFPLFLGAFNRGLLIVLLSVCLQSVVVWGADFSDAVDNELPAGVSSGFDTAFENTISLWLDANIESSVIKSGNNVSQWNNLSGNDHAVTNGGSPQYDSTNKMISFDGNDYFFVENQTVDSDTTYFIVFKSNGGNGTLFAKANASGNWSQGGKTFFIRSNRLGSDVGWVGALQANTITNDNNTTIAMFEHNQSYSGSTDQLKIYRNAVLDGSKTWNFDNWSESTLTSGGKFKIGYTSTNFPGPTGLTGKIAELIKINQLLTNEEQIIINYYLSNKWGLTTSMDSDGDGVLDASDGAPTDPSSTAAPLPDFSDTVDSEIGIASGLSSVESNLNLWLDASNINENNNSGISNGDPITQWNDLSGNNNHVSQGTASKKPEYLNNGVKFMYEAVYSGNNDYLYTQSATDMPGGDEERSVFFVYSNINCSNCAKRFIGFGQGGSTGTVFDLGSDMTFVHLWGSGENVSGFTPLDDTTYIRQVSYKSPNISGFSNGIQYFDKELKDMTSPIAGNSINTVDPNKIHIGTWSPPNQTVQTARGMINEVLLFDHLVSDSDRAKINFYLSKKWGLTASVDSDGDGDTDAVEIAAGTDPMSGGSDFSDSVDAEIGSASGLNSVEPNLKLWLDASNINGNDNAGISDDDTITQWNDLSGNDHHAINANSQVKFREDNFGDAADNNHAIDLINSGSNDNATDYLDILNMASQSNQNMTLFIIFDPKASHWDDILLDARINDSGAGTTMYQIMDESQNSGVTLRAINSPNTNFTSFSKPIVMSVKTNSSSGDMFINGALLYDNHSSIKPASATGVQRIRLGGPYQHWDPNRIEDHGGSDATVSELLIFYEELSDSDIVKINYYLSKKWDLESVMDSDGDGLMDDVDAEPMTPLDPSIFLTKWGSIDSSTTITIPLVGSETYHFEINWGDGSVAETKQGAGSGLTVNHTYSSSYDSVYITIKPLGNSGTTGFPRIYFNGNNCTKLKEVMVWGTTKWSSMASAFKNCDNLNITAIDAPDLSNVTSMTYMFQDSGNFVVNGNISHWNTSTITNMSGMFQKADNFNHNISNWNVSSVQYMGYMFKDAEAFNQNLSSWDTSEVLDMQWMFSHNVGFNNGGQPLTWNTSKVTNMQWMFFASNFDQDISSWDVSEVTAMNQMFYGSKVDQNISNWDVSKVTNMYRMFIQNSDFNQDISSWDVSAVTNMGGMFQDASVFNQNIANWNIKADANLSSMFSSNTGLSDENKCAIYTAFNTHQNWSTAGASNWENYCPLDFSDTVDAEIGSASGLNSVEPNLKLWLDASNINGNNNSGISNGTSISQWSDLSGNNHHALQSSGNKPQYSSNTISFDGTDDFMTINDHSDLTIGTGSGKKFTMVVVYKAHTLNENSFIIGRRTGSSSNTTDYLLYLSYSSSKLRFGTGPSADTGAWWSFAAPNLNQTHIAFMTLNQTSNTGGMKQFYLNGEVKTNPENYPYTQKASAAANTYIGSNNGSTTGTFDGDLYEVLIFNEDLDASERYKINYYLSKKWGLTAFIDSDGDGIYDDIDKYPTDDSKKHIIISSPKTFSTSTDFIAIGSPSTEITAAGNLTISSVIKLPTITSSGQLTISSDQLHTPAINGGTLSVNGGTLYTDDLNASTTNQTGGAIAKLTFDYIPLQISNIFNQTGGLIYLYINSNIQYETLTLVGNNIVLNGTLSILKNSFDPKPGEIYPLINGNFTGNPTIIAPNLVQGTEWDTRGIFINTNRKVRIIYSGHPMLGFGF